MQENLLDMKLPHNTIKTFKSSCLEKRLQFFMRKSSRFTQINLLTASIRPMLTQLNRQFCMVQTTGSVTFLQIMIVKGLTAFRVFRKSDIFEFKINEFD